MFFLDFKEFFWLLGCEQKVAKVISDSTEETVEPFKTNMVGFLDKGEIEKTFYNKFHNANLEPLK